LPFGQFTFCGEQAATHSRKCLHFREILRQAHCVTVTEEEDNIMIPTPEQAWELLCRYNEGDFHRKHGRIVGDVLRWYAQELGYGEEADFWETVGILHDLDFEQWPEEHCTKEQELMRQEGIDERIIHATASHGYALTVDVKPEHQMEKVLYAADELTGLIGAVAIMRPSKSVSDLEVKSVRKKYKDKKFAAGCSREVIERGAEMLGWPLDELIEKTILAMRASSAVD
jgi:predicted hydrolase (HD superfamily)